MELTHDDRRQALRNIDQRRRELADELAKIAAELAHMNRCEEEHRAALGVENDQQ